MKRWIAVLTLLCILICEIVLWFAPPADGTPTSTAYRYEAAFSKAVEKYPDLASYYEPAYMPAVPGLENTDIDGTACENMVPQGMCLAGDYLLITAYDAEEKKPSVVYVLSNVGEDRGSYLTTLVLPNINHVGGIAYDGAYLWIAQSSDKTLKGFSYESLQQAAASGAGSVRMEYEVASNRLLNTASLVTFYDGLLWVGTFAQNAQGILYGYRAQVNGDSAVLTAERSMVLPAQTQGVAFAEAGGRTVLLASCSYGRKNDSRLHVYYPAYNEPAENGEIALGEAAKTLTLPPMLEQIYMHGGALYCLFESAATEYSTNLLNKCPYPVDRIVLLDSVALLGQL